MALRSPALFMGNPAINHTAQNDRLSKAGLLRPEAAQTATNRPLTAASGVAMGPPGTMGEVTLLSNTQFTVNPARWYLQSTDSALGGVYEVTNDAVETLTITAQDAALYRLSYFGVWVIDSFVAGSGDDQPHWGLINGGLAASNPQLPVAGQLPENFLPLGQFSIPPTGQAVTYTPYEVITGPRGASILIGKESNLQTVNPATGATTVVTSGSYDGARRHCIDTGADAVWDATAGRWLFYDTKWQSYTPTLSNGAVPGTPWGTVGNAFLRGEYFRIGREIRCRGVAQLGSTTSFGGAGGGGINAGYPPGYVASEFSNAFIDPQGVGMINNGSYQTVVAGLAPATTAASRRINLWSATNPLATVSGTAGTYGVSAVNHVLSWTVTYHTEFEA